MQNLAGNSDCDRYIREELFEAGVLVVQHDEPLNREVPASVTGELRLNGVVVFRFIRAWYYWVVTGEVPLEVAKDIYSQHFGKEVRVGGHAGSPPPDGKVISYHIDTQRALNLFVRTLKENGLSDELTQDPKEVFV